MLLLSTNHLKVDRRPVEPTVAIMRVSTETERPIPFRRKEIFLWRGGEVPDDYAAYAYFSDEAAVPSAPESAIVIALPPTMEYLAHGDVIKVDLSRNYLRVLYRRSSPFNSFLVTERCNHLCLMCSQPPKNVDDGWLVDEIDKTIRLMDADTVEIGFTGGEPTLLSDRFINILTLAKNYLPRTAIHILSNGRRFAERDFVEKFAAIEHHDMMVGIPLYSDVSSIHDYVVQADGAFDETVRGILNLKRLKQKVELRVVVHQQTYKRLPQLAEFIARNLVFLDHVALMGLEMTGFTRANLDALWIDPAEYQRELRAAVETLHGHRMNVSIYNHQLCLLDRSLWPFARRSISDWKNEYMPECAGCAVQDQCGGFFSSAHYRYSDQIRPIGHVDG